MKTLLNMLRVIGLMILFLVGMAGLVIAPFLWLSFKLLGVIPSEILKYLLCIVLLGALGVLIKKISQAIVPKILEKDDGDDPWTDR